MSSTAVTAPEAAGDQPRGRAQGPIIDADIHNYLPSHATIREYLPQRWRTYHQSFGTRNPNSIAFFPTRPRNMAARADAWPDKGAPGSDLDLMRSQHLDLWDITIGILNPLEQIFMGSQFPAFSAALTTALNHYTLERWVEPEPRLYASICVPYEDPDFAVEEIHRLGDHPRFVQVLLNLRTRDPFGHRKYWKIYEAAVAHDLPIAVHVGGVGGNTITGAGFPSYYFEDHAGYPQAFQAHIISMVFEGVFDAFPTLKFVCQEGGFAWVPWLSWRMDRAWGLLRDEVPHVKRPPSEYIREHLWYTTQPIEEPEHPHQFAELLGQTDALGISDRLLFSSDYPHWDFDAPDRALPKLMSRELKVGVLSGHAAQLTGLPMSPEVGLSPRIDCDVHVPTPSVAQLHPHIPHHWNEYIANAGFDGTMAVTSTYPPGAPTTGTDRFGASLSEALDNLRRCTLGDDPSARAVVSTHYGVEAMGPPDFSITMARAVNDWLINDCLSADERLLGSIVVPPQYPELAADEVERVGGHPQVVQVFLPARAVKPYGNRTYYPIFAAAEGLGLAIGVGFGGMTWTPPTPVGWPSYYVEEYVGMAHIMQAQVSSLILEGTFQRFPTLRVALLEGGWTWLPPLLWRLDKEWKGIRREVPWLTEAPSAYLRRHVRVSLQPIDAPAKGDDVLTVLDQIGSDDVLMFATDFPHVHNSDPAALVRRLPSDLATKILHDNAVDCYGLAVGVG